MHQITAASQKIPQKTHTNQNSTWSDFAKIIPLVIAISLATLTITENFKPTAYVSLANSAVTFFYLRETSRHSFFKDLDRLQTIGSISPQTHANLTAQSIDLTSSKFKDYVNSLSQGAVFRKPAISKSTAANILSSYFLTQKNKQTLPQIYVNERASTDRNSNLTNAIGLISLMTISLISLHTTAECIRAFHG